MHRNLNTSLTTKASLFFKLLIACSLVFIGFVSFNSCNGKHADNVSTNNVDTNAISYDSLRILLSDTTKVNWLDGHGWDTVEIDAKMEDRVKIQNEMQKIRYYVEGALTEYNITFPLQDDNIPYNVKEFRYAVKSVNPLRFTVIAYLTPQAQKLLAHDHDQNQDHDHGDRPFGHLKPPEPPPPGK